jgi:ribosomal protein S18 acetylase RimI-like enzyme
MTTAQNQDKYNTYYKIVPVKLKTHIKEMMAINEQMLPEHYIQEYWAFIIAQHHSFVAVDKNKKVVGYCLAGIPPTPELKRDPKGKVGIVSLAVLKDYQGLKIGKSLLIEACSSVKTQYTEVYLNVRVSNTVAHNLYLSQGFIDAKVIPKYYPDDDGILMKNDL